MAKKRLIKVGDTVIYEYRSLSGIIKEERKIVDIKTNYRGYSIAVFENSHEDYLEKCTLIEFS